MFEKFKTAIIVIGFVVAAAIVVSIFYTFGPVIGGGSLFGLVLSMFGIRREADNGSGNQNMGGRQGPRNDPHGIDLARTQRREAESALERASGEVASHGKSVESGDKRREELIDESRGRFRKDVTESDALDDSD